jgi:hypothetical protein
MTIAKSFSWAFKEARKRGAKAFIFLGDFRLTPERDVSVDIGPLNEWIPIPFYPIIGNHEVEQFGFFRLRPFERLLGYDPEAEFQKRFLGGTPKSPASSKLCDTTTYSVGLEGGVHFIALDNVGLERFGDAQLKWLEQDLSTARADPRTRYIVVGMHKPLARNPCTTHSMDEDGQLAIDDSDRALRLFKWYNVTLIVASHEHGYAEFRQDGIQTYITGGLGAPTEHHGDVFFPHILQVDVDASKVSVAVVAERTACRPSPLFLGD